MEYMLVDFLIKIFYFETNSKYIFNENITDGGGAMQIGS